MRRGGAELVGDASVALADGNGDGLGRVQVGWEGVDDGRGSLSGVDDAA